MKYNAEAAATASATSKEVLPKGIYKFKCLAAKEKTSQSGNPMIVLTLLVHNKANSGQVTDYLGDWAYGSIKILGFLDSIGLPTASGELYPNQVVGRQGYLKLDVKESTNPKYPGPQNNVVKYLSHSDMVAEGYLKPSTPPLTNPEPPPPVKEEPLVPVMAGAIEDDDLPF